ncbi:MAG: N-acetylmuramic acid 6-phosphate etherase [Paracoccaceae bacterium]
MLLPQTEMMPDKKDCIDAMSSSTALSAMLKGQVAAVWAVQHALPQIELGATLVADTIRRGGTLVYTAAGSSGLMGLADGAELPGTFGIPQNQIRILMAGGVPADGTMPGDTEDDDTGALKLVDQLSDTDLLIMLSASGTTPYPCEIATHARDRGIKIVAIANNAGSTLLELADVAICVPTPPEVLAGSTRLGAGTAQKVTLNMMSTLTGVLLGHVYNGMMVNLHVENAKLRLRAQMIVSNIAKVSSEIAQEALRTAENDTKLAVLIATGRTVEKARKLLNQHDGHLGPCLSALAKE